MRWLYKTLAVCFWILAFVLVYTLRIYALCSALMLLAWFGLILTGVVCRSQSFLRVSAVCWAVILLGFALSLIFPVANPALPALFAFLRRIYYAVFILPLCGLPAVRFVCIPISLLMLGLSIFGQKLVLWLEEKHRI